MRINDRVLALAGDVEKSLAERFFEIDRISQENTRRVLEAFQDCRVSDSFFGGTTGYGYDDRGREVLDELYAKIFGAEAALVRLGFVNGTHAISSALFAALKPGQVMLSVTGAPYDTLMSAIGINGDNHGSLKSLGIGYEETPLTDEGKPDYDAIASAVKAENIGIAFIQRSRGYSTRRSLMVSEIEKIVRCVKDNNPDVLVVVDNCYGEFTETLEPTHVGADLIAGSLIKNPGGGIAPTGGYVAGRADLVENAAFRLTAPGIGGECGPTLGQSRLFFQGLFLAPHVVAQAVKTSVFCAGMLEELGYNTSPSPWEDRSDIIQVIELGSPEKLVKFCQGIQAASPVDSFVSPEPWQMPGYDCPVVMAAGTFVQGSSIELSADGPLREPYLAYLQGGLTYESGRLGIISGISEMLGDE